MNEKNMIELDLKWSLWSEERGAFPDGVVDAILLAWSGSGDLEIRTAPKKEIRFGTVIVRSGGADVEFNYEWDDPEDLASSLSVEDMSDEETYFAARKISDFLNAFDWGVSRS